MKKSILEFTDTSFFIKIPSEGTAIIGNNNIIIIKGIYIKFV